MPTPKITSASNNIVYLDFDGTLTGISGREVIGTELCTGLKIANSVEDRAKFKELYQSSNDDIKITKDAKIFLNRINALYPHVQIVIVSRNYENYIRALLEFEEIDTSHITIYPRGMKGRGPGEDKRTAVFDHEKKCTPGIRFVADDFEDDYLEMGKGLDKENNIVFGETTTPKNFNWKESFYKIWQKVNHLFPVSEYLNGSTINRFHLFPANTNSTPLAKVKEQYADVVGDDLKRRILHDLKGRVADINTLDDLFALKKQYKSSLEYQVIAQGQGITTRLFRLETDSQRAVESIFRSREDVLQIAPASPTL